jgi:hypothetical protein
MEKDTEDAEKGSDEAEKSKEDGETKEDETKSHLLVPKVTNQPVPRSQWRRTREPK